ncbi:urease accessory protein UreE [Methylobacterium nigriterrae]|uniref:urease accessory protein UreE n=1 Tax=Methylobacterium nigriterrae TaxID=3127512 RepID=UPI003013D1EB
MLRATTIVRKAAVRPEQVVDTITLDHAGRRRNSGSLTAESGLSFELALARAALLDDGDALRLEDGRLVQVRAAGEALLEVRAENPARLMRLAWQLGGSHVAAEIAADALYVPASPANAELIRGQGCTATAVTRAFRPEREAHDHSTCGHEHHHRAHDHGHEHHDHRHDPAHDHGHRHEHAHSHGPGCGCGHDH